MHQTHLILRSALASLLLAVTAAGAALAQPAGTPRPGSEPVDTQGGRRIVPIGSTVRVQMSTKKNILTVNNPRANVARVQSVPDDPTSIQITGVEAGVTVITLVDENKVQERLEVIVEFDVAFLRTLLQRAAPTAVINPLPGANNAIVLTGTVMHAEDIDVIMRVAVAVVGGADRVVNAMRVGGVQQVQLDVAVARVSRTETRRMSFDFEEFGHNHFFASAPGQGFLIPQPGQIVPGLVTATPNFVNLANTTSGVPANLFLAVFNKDQNFFGLLQALRDEQVAKIMAKPSLVTLSGRPASFLDGGEQAVPVPAGLGQIGVQFEEFGTRLNFLPIVLGNGRIHLEVEPEVSTLDPTSGTSINGTIVPGRLTQRIHTTVELEDGQTYVLGGLIQNRVQADDTKVPILGDLPFIGAAFSRKQFREDENELVILVTPHLVDAMSCDQAPKALPGQETRSPDDFELFLEGILEAPHGSRVVCPDHRYVPAWKNGPTAATFPCAGGADGKCGAPNGVTGLPGSCSPGTGTVQPAGVSYPGSLAPSVGSQDIKQESKPLSSDGGMPKAASLGTITLPATELSPSAASTTSKPTTLPPALTGPSGDAGRND